MRAMPKLSIKTARPRRGPPVFVCRKCLKRAPEGPAIKRALKKAIQREAAREAEESLRNAGDAAPDRRAARKAAKRARPRLILTSCFGICPPKAVVVATAATLSRGEYWLAEDKSGAQQMVESCQPDKIRSENL
jgi:hypothetical protein